MVKFGDIGSEVSEVQKLLSMLGYDLIVDGSFGSKTLRSVKAFQKKYNLEVDGAVGNKTLLALKAAQKKSSKESTENISSIDYNDLQINKDYELPSEQYIKQKTEKSQIFIHFTAGRPSAKNCISGWNADESKIATAFIIDGDTGIPYQAFNPDFWGWHLGIKNTNGRLDKSSVGIEICSFGPLKEKGGKFYAWPKDFTTEVAKENVYTLDKDFRGFKHFFAYTEEQLVSLEKLICFLVERYNIKVQSGFDESWFDYKEDVINKTLPGIWTHVNVRKDKTDSYPDTRLIELLNRISKKYNG